MVRATSVIVLASVALNVAPSYASTSHAEATQLIARDIEYDEIMEIFARSDIDELDARSLGHAVKPALNTLKKVAPFAPLLTMLPMGGGQPQPQPQRRELEELARIFARSDIDQLDERSLGSFLKPAVKTLKKVAPHIPLVGGLVGGALAANQQPQRRDLEDFSEIFSRSEIDQLDERGLGSLLKPALKVVKKVAPHLPLVGGLVGGALAAGQGSQPPPQQRRDLDEFAVIAARSDIEQLDERSLGGLFKPLIKTVKKVAPHIPLVGGLVGGALAANQASQPPPQRRDLEEFADLFSRSDIDQLDERGLGSIFKPAVNVIKKVAPHLPLVGGLVGGAVAANQASQPQQRRDLEEFAEIFARSDIDELDERGLGGLLKPLVKTVKKVAPHIPVVGGLIGGGLAYGQAQQQPQRREFDDIAELLARSEIPDISARELQQLHEILARDDLEELDARGLGSLLKPIIPIAKKVGKALPLVGGLLGSLGGSSSPPPPPPPPPQQQQHKRDLEDLVDYEALFARGDTWNVAERDYDEYAELQARRNIPPIFRTHPGFNLKPPSQMIQAREADEAELQELLARADLTELERRGLFSLFKPIAKVAKKVAAPILGGISGGSGGGSNQQQQKQKRELADIIARAIIDEYQENYKREYDEYFDEIVARNYRQVNDLD